MLLIFSFLFSVMTAYMFSAALVFVHIGEEIPEYALQAVKQARLFNKNTKIYFLGNSNPSAIENIKTIAEYIDYNTIPKTNEHIRFIRDSQFKTQFRNGFWKYTYERFLYLNDFVQHHTLSNIVHLENDVMLYRDIDDLIPTMKKCYRGLATTFDSDKRAIASIVYIKDSSAMQHFSEFLAKNARSGKNDMITLSKYQKAYGENAIGHLPIAPSILSLNKVNKYQIRKIPNAFTSKFSEFNSIFDACAIGQYLGGIDPRNGNSCPGFVNETAIVDPRIFNYIWKKDAKGRLIPYAKVGGIEYKINNLHIHSKNLTKFSS